MNLSRRQWLSLMVVTSGLVRGPANAAPPSAEATEVNTASQAELERIKGLGPALSDQILAQRRERPFRDWPDFMARIAGIGPARARKLAAAGLTVAGQTWPAEAPARTASGLTP